MEVVCGLLEAIGMRNKGMKKFNPAIILAKVWNWLSFCNYLGIHENCKKCQVLKNVILQNMLFVYNKHVIVALTFVVRLNFSKILLWNRKMYRVVAMIKEWSCNCRNPVFLMNIATWQPVSPRIFFWGWIQNSRME